MSTRVLLTGAAIILALGVAVTIVPIPRPFGMDAGSMGALEVSLATSIALILTYYGLFGKDHV
jgi:hypothetical protein